MKFHSGEKVRILSGGPEKLNGEIGTVINCHAPFYFILAHNYHWMYHYDELQKI